MSINVGIVGAGALGTAISKSIAINVDNVYLYARRESVRDEINLTRYNSGYYPNLLLEDNIIATSDFNDLKCCKVIFFCIPSSVVRDTIKKLANIISEDAIIVSAAKGLDDSYKRMSELIEEYHKSFVVFSGPNIAAEIALKLPTATTISSKSPENLDIVKKVLSTEEFRVSTTDDVIGTELCGVIKNIVAISLGICEGMDINDNARFAVLTKGFMETKEIIKRLGGKSSTVDSYCGFGDIVTASTLSVSRNHTLGVFYGQKLRIDEQKSGVIFEGKKSSKIMKEICDKRNISSSIIDFVYEVIIKEINPRESFKKLWSKIE